MKTPSIFHDPASNLSVPRQQYNAIIIEVINSGVGVPVRQVTKSLKSSTRYSIVLSLVQVIGLLCFS